MWLYSLVFALVAAITSYIITSETFQSENKGISSAVLISTLVSLFWSRFLISALFTRNKLSIFNQVLFGVVVATFTIFISAGLFGLIKVNSIEAYKELGFFGAVINILGSGVMATVYSYLTYWWFILPAFIGTAFLLRWVTVRSYNEKIA